VPQRGKMGLPLLLGSRCIAVKKRRRIKQEQPLAVRLAEEAKRLRKEAHSLRPGARRTELLRRAEDLASGVQMATLLSSSSETKSVEPEDEDGRL
jgi:hypothetical protein